MGGLEDFIGHHRFFDYFFHGCRLIAGFQKVCNVYSFRNCRLAHFSRKVGEIVGLNRLVRTFGNISEKYVKYAILITSEVADFIEVCTNPATLQPQLAMRFIRIYHLVKPFEPV